MPASTAFRLIGMSYSSRKSCTEAWRSFGSPRSVFTRMLMPGLTHSTSGVTTAVGKPAGGRPLPCWTRFQSRSLIPLLVAITALPTYLPSLASSASLRLLALDAEQFEFADVPAFDFHPSLVLAAASVWATPTLRNNALEAHCLCGLIECGAAAPRRAG